MSAYSRRRIRRFSAATNFFETTDSAPELTDPVPYTSKTTPRAIDRAMDALDPSSQRESGREVRMLRPRRFEREYDPGPVQIQARKVHFDLSETPLRCRR